MRIGYKKLEAIKQWVQNDLCKSTRNVFTYPPNNIRVTVNSHELNKIDYDININYIDDSLWNNLYPDLGNLTLRDIRFGWSLIKVLNGFLKDTLSLIKIVPINLKSYWLSSGVYLSSYRKLIMVPLKSDLMKIVLQKTSLPRENAPKIVFNRKDLSESEFSNKNK